MSTVADEELDGPLTVEYEGWLADDEEARAARRRRVRLIALVIIAFAITRGFAGYVADHPTFYGSNVADATGDVHRYDFLTWSMRHEGNSPYGTELHTEYPPGAIAVMMVPRYVRAVSYRTEFIAMMVLVDAIGLLALARIARRTGSWWGAATWFVLLPALGPVAYTRLDLVVAVLLLWTMERALAGRWDHVGLLIGIGAAVKLVPILLLPMLFFVVPRGQRRKLVGWCAGVVGVAMLPFVLQLPDLYKSVISYHAERGIQAESLWGAGVLSAKWIGNYSATIVPSHLSFDISSDVSDLLTTLSTVVSFAIVVLGVVLAFRTRTGDVRRASFLVLGTMSLLVAFGKVYSPQYLMWLVALAAVAMAIAPRLATPATVVLAGTCLLAHLLFPIWFWDLISYDKGGAVIALAIRNTLTVIVGILGLWGWWAYGRRARLEEGAAVTLSSELDAAPELAAT